MLYLVATPIGNLGDISLRALEILRSVDYVASEDTRKTGLLLKHFEIKKPQISYHEYNEREAGEKLMDLLDQGKSIALVTNAGTPGISDPGFILVRKAIQAGIPLTSIPGPAAFVSALVTSGLPVHSFTFRGFPPHKAGGRRKFLQQDQDAPYTLIYYESPYRIKSFLADALEIFGDRQAVIANDLTKMFERVYRGTLTDLIQQYENLDIKGEFTVLIAGKIPAAGLNDG
jgi:16S rRNA (cytidine1402-2'-O)-methyltransferase